MSRKQKASDRKRGDALSPIHYELSDPYPLTVEGTSPASGDPVGDRFVFSMGERIIVVNTSAPGVYAHDVKGNKIQVPRALNVHGTSPASGDPINDRFVFPMGDRIIVVNTAAPGVYAHKVKGDEVHVPSVLKVEGTSPGSGDPASDRFMFPFCDYICVLNTASNDLWAHRVKGDTVCAPEHCGTLAISSDAKYLVPISESAGRYTFNWLWIIDSVKSTCMQVDLLKGVTPCGDSDTISTLPASADPAGFRFAFAQYQNGKGRILTVNPTLPGVYGFDMFVVPD